MSKRQHPSTRRNPQTPHDQDDAFVAGVIDFSEWARTHRQALTLIGVAVAVAVGDDDPAVARKARLAQTRLAHIQ